MAEYRRQALDRLQVQHGNYSPEMSANVNLRFIPLRIIKDMIELLCLGDETTGKRDYGNLANFFHMNTREIMAIERDYVRPSMITYTIFCKGAEKGRTYLDLLQFLMKNEISGITDLINAWPETWYNYSLTQHIQQGGEQGSWNCPLTTSDVSSGTRGNNDFNNLSPNCAESVVSDSNNSHYPASEGLVNYPPLPSDLLDETARQTFLINRLLESSVCHQVEVHPSPVENSDPVQLRDDLNPIQQNQYTELDTDQTISKSILCVAVPKKTSGFQNNAVPPGGVTKLLGNHDNKAICEFSTSKSKCGDDPVLKNKKVCKSDLNNNTNFKIVSRTNENRSPINNPSGFEKIPDLSKHSGQLTQVYQRQQPTETNHVLVHPEINSVFIEQEEKSEADQRLPVHPKTNPSDLYNQEKRSEADCSDWRSEDMFGYGPFIPPSEMISSAGDKIHHLSAVVETTVLLEKPNFVMIVTAGDPKSVTTAKCLLSDLEKVNIPFIADLPGEIKISKKMAVDAQLMSEKYRTWLRLQFKKASVILLLISKDFRNYVNYRSWWVTTDKERHQKNQAVLVNWMKEESKQKGCDRFLPVLIDQSYINQTDLYPKWIQGATRYKYTTSAESENFTTSALYCKCLQDINITSAV